MFLLYAMYLDFFNTLVRCKFFVNRKDILFKSDQGLLLRSPTEDWHLLLEYEFRLAVNIGRKSNIISVTES